MTKRQKEETYMGGIEPINSLSRGDLLEGRINHGTIRHIVRIADSEWLLNILGQNIKKAGFL